MVALLDQRDRLAVAANTGEIAMSDWFSWLGTRVDPVSAVCIEARMFTLAREMVDGYEGGHWGVASIGEVPAPELPQSLSARVTIKNAGNGSEVVTDPCTAALAIAYLAVNHRLCTTYERGREDLAQQCADVQTILVDLARLLDAASFFAITD